MAAKIGLKKFTAKCYYRETIEPELLVIEQIGSVALLIVTFDNGLKVCLGKYDSDVAALKWLSELKNR